MAAIKLTDEQKSIIEDPDTTSDTLIIAGAGSGKTFTMTNRIIELIHKGVRPDQILGLTFTKKATAELNQRVLAALPPREHTHPQVSTYDSFFQSIVRRYGILIGADPTAQPLSGAGRYQLAQNVVSDHMEEIFARWNVKDPLQMTSDPSHQPIIQPPSLSQLAGKLISFENECLSYMIDEHRTSFADALKASRQWNDTLIVRLRTLLSAARKDYPDVYDQVVIDGGKAPKAPKAPIDDGKKTAKSAAAAEKAVRRAEENWDKYRTKAQIAHGYSLYRTALSRSLVMDLAQDFYQLKRDNHLAEFSDFPAYALQLLSRFPSIGSEYRSRYRYVFLDEYQDTSTTQARLLALLFHASSSDRSVVTAVGDPFQSIYGWRGASPSAFTLFTQDFEIPSSRIKTLSATVRNRPLVLDVANHVTDTLRNPDMLRRASVSRTTDDAFEKQTPVKKLTTLPGRSRGHAPDATVSVLAFLTTAQEARAVAQFASRHVKSHPGEQVAILLRSSTHFDDFRKAVQAQGLRCQVVGREDPRTSPEVQDLLSALKAVADPSDSTPLMRLLASARYGLSSHDLEALAQAATTENEDHQYQALVAAGIARGDEDQKARHDVIVANRDRLPATISVVDVLLSEQCHDILAALPPTQALSQQGMTAVLDLSRILRTIEQQSNGSVQTCVRTAISALGLEGDLSVARALSGGEHGFDSVPVRSDIASNLDVILDQVDVYTSELPPSLAPTLGGFVTWLDSLPAEDISAATPDQNDSSSADVVIMTVHQSKGLEWPAVAVAAVNDGSFPSSDSVRIRGPKAQKGTSQHVMTVSPEVWIENDAAVPAPLRSDAFVLPAFPHGATRGNNADPIGDIRRLSSLQQIGEEVFAPDAKAIVSSDDTSTHSIVPEFPSLEERYGERAWADEMRIAYVALTRTSGDLMVSGIPGSLKNCAGLFAPSDQTCDDGASVDQVAHNLVSNLSPLWRAIAQGVKESTESAHQPIQNIQCVRSSHVVNSIDREQDQKLHERVSHMTQLPSWASTCIDKNLEPQIEAVGVCAGEDASAVSHMWNTTLSYQTAAQMALEAIGQSGQLVWPARISPRSEKVLAQSAASVRTSMEQLQVRDQQEKDQQEKGQSESEEDGPLTVLVKRLAARLETSQTLSTALSTEQANHSDRTMSQAELEARASQALKGQSISATRLQRLVMPENEEEQREALIEIVRPMPQAPNQAAQKGTLFHAWVADQLDPTTGEVDDETVDEETVSSLATSSSADAHMLERLAHIQSNPDSPEARAIRYWQNAFEYSVWPHRTVVGVEQQFALSIAGHRVPARLDAVFCGRLHDAPGNETEGAYTIIDWKTGSVPHSARDREDKLFQLRIYRLALTHALGIDPHRVDAALFYVSAHDPAHQLYELHDYRSLEEITASVSSDSRLLHFLRSDTNDEE